MKPATGQHARTRAATANAVATGTHACAPRILLVEDDATSRAFLAAALAGLPARVCAATGAAEALALVAAGPAFDLWLVDAHLPDADGAGLLAALRLLDPATPALAHTAARDPAQAAALRACGFDGVLRKPLALATLRAAVRRRLRASRAVAGDAVGRNARDAAGHAARGTARDAAGGAIAEAPAAWPDARAATAASRRDKAFALAGLRAMFHAELPAQRAAIERALARGDVATATGVLHRLRASCGFAGAAALGAAVRALQAEPESAAVLSRFVACVEAVLALAAADAD